MLFAWETIRYGYRNKFIFSIITAAHIGLAHPRFLCFEYPNYYTTVCAVGSGTWCSPLS